MSYLYIRKLVNLFYPARCMFCRKQIEDERRLLVCPECLEKYEKPGMQEILLPGTYGKCAYALDYRDEVRHALLRFKFSGMPQYAHGLAHFMLPEVEKHISVDFISWAPISPIRHMRRTYDQSKLLAAELSRTSGIPLAASLRKCRHNPQQSKRSASERFINVQDVYRVLHPARIQGARILLVDDIVTTGATLCECMKMLYQAGAAEVFCIALAHGTGKK